jgi:hypothetical protein
MSFARAVLVWKITALALAAVYAVAALLGMGAGFDSTRDTILWVAFLGGGALLIVLGSLLFASSPWVGAGLVSVGAAAGGLPLVWSILVPLVAAVVIALSISIARQISSSPA